MILYALISAIIIVLLSAIGFLMTFGLKSLRAEIVALRQDIKDNHDSEMELRGKLSALDSKCEERHKRLDFEIAEMKKTAAG